MASCANMGEASARMESQRSRFMSKASGLLIDGPIEEISLTRTRVSCTGTLASTVHSSASIARAIPQVDRNPIRGFDEGFKTNRDARFDCARRGYRGIWHGRVGSNGGNCQARATVPAAELPL